jgi:nucleoside-diphosphate-sugar epimerase
MKVVVFGGAGFIGCTLVEKLLDQFFEVYVIDNFRKGIESVASFMPRNRLDIRYGDIRNIHQIKKQIIEIDPDAIVLASGIVGLDDCNNNPDETKNVNVDGWRNVADSCVGYPIIGLSTGSVYGKLEEVCTEDSPCNPVSLYGTTKLEGEKPILDVGGVIYRYATAGGVSRNMRFNLLTNELTRDAVINRRLDVYQPEVRRTFISIDDFANSIIFAINNHPFMCGKIYNVGDNNNNWTKRQLVEYVQKKTGCGVFYNNDKEDADLRDYEVSYNKINKLGFKCQVSVEKMLDDLIKYHTEQTYSKYELDPKYIDMYFGKENK